MFCFQCEQTRDGVGCKTVGVCGKEPETAALQDLLIHTLKRLSQDAVKAKAVGIETGTDTDFFVQEAIFATLTNVNFDPKSIHHFVTETEQRRQELRRRVLAAGGEEKGTGGKEEEEAILKAREIESLEAAVERGRGVGVEERRKGVNEDVFSLQELLTYGIKGTAAYAAHAYAVGKRDASISHFIYEAFNYVSQPPEEQSVEELLLLALRCGEVNLRAMQILNEGHCSSFGIPEPTTVRTNPVKGKCIAVSGHDIRDLFELLKATEGKGINVYTHGELLPAHAYPELKRFPHLVGNYGGPWQLQKMEFAAFPGPILVTTNCILQPKPSYEDRIYSANAVGHSQVKHIEGRDFSPLVKQALEMEGFKEDASPPTTTMTGFGHDAVLSVADTVVDLVKRGKIKRFFLIGGCDGFEGERSYYRDLALSLPKDTVILTLACGKYRFNKMMDVFGTIEGTNLPRVMDIGQCNDAYSAIRIASALAEAFETDVNSLPLSLVISWFEQKAVAVLLTLLHLGIRNIRIGPKLPAFVTPNVLNVLVEKYALTPIGGPDRVQEDMHDMMGTSAAASA